MHSSIALTEMVSVPWFHRTVIVLGLVAVGIVGSMYLWVWWVSGRVHREPVTGSPADIDVTRVQQASWWRLGELHARSTLPEMPIQRNLFRFAQTVRNHPAPAEPQNVPAPPQVKVQIPAAPKPPPEPPAPETRRTRDGRLQPYRLIGMVRTVQGDIAYAVITDGRDIWVVLPGMTVNGRFRVRTIDATGVLITTPDSTVERRLEFPKEKR